MADENAQQQLIKSEASEVQLTSKIASEMGLSLDVLHKAILSGKVKGRQISDRIWLISTSELPKPKTVEQVVPQSPALVDARQKIQEAIELSKLETQKIEAEIKLAEAQGKRDKPEQLAKREASLNERETKLNEQEQSITQRLKDVETKEIELQNKQKSLDDERLRYSEQSAKETMSLKNRLTDIQKGHELLMSQKQAELDEVREEIERETETLQKLKELHTQYKGVITPYFEQVAKLKRLCDGLAGREYQRSEVSKGEEKEMHMQRAEHGWALSTGLERVTAWMKKLNG